MIRNLITALSFVVIVLLASCSSMKPVSSASNKPKIASPASTSLPTGNKKNDVKFLDQISSNPQVAAAIPDTKTEKKESASTGYESNGGNSTSVENASGLQLKYAQLLNTEVEQIKATELLKSVDEWYGTRYRMGGNSKSGIDCSAFVQAVYLSAFGMSVPRTAFEQYRVAYHISATEMREGDLVFFNTTGGVSHVGIYLRNNKFIHASVSRGVAVSDLFDPYYLKRFLGVGRIEKSIGNR
jgi:cell wall-associated NlpC family hydrolase